MCWITHHHHEINENEVEFHPHLPHTLHYFNGCGPVVCFVDDALGENGLLGTLQNLAHYLPVQMGIVLMIEMKLSKQLRRKEKL